jgi:hypothetical protein
MSAEESALIAALRKKYEIYAVARELSEASADALQQLTEAERAARALTGSGDADPLRSVFDTAPTTAASSSSTSQQQQLEAPSTAAAAAAARAARLRICKECNGLGIVKVIYNHVVRDKTCPTCEGDGVFEPQPSSSSAASAAAPAGAHPKKEEEEEEEEGEGEDDGPPPLEEAQ